MRLGRIAIAIGISAYLLVAGSGELSRRMPWRLLTLLTLMLIASAWAAGCVLFRSWRPRARLTVPVLIVAAAYAASAITSIEQRLSFEPLVFGLGAVAIFLIFERLLEREEIRELVRYAAIALVAIVVVGYLAIVLTQWVEWWGLVGRLTRPPIRPGSVGFIVGGPNSMAGFPMLLGPLAIVELVRHGRPGKLAGIVLAGAILAAALISGSRGGSLGFGAGLLALLVLRPMAWRKLNRMVRVVITAGTLGTAVAAVALVLAGRGGNDGMDLRLHLWEQSGRLAAEHPLLGTGPGTWEIARYAILRPGDDTSLVSHAHNVAIQTLAELGGIGLLAWIALVGAVAILLLRLVRDGADRRIEVIAIAVGLASVVGQSLVENFTDIPLVTLSTVILVAYADALAAPEPGMLSRLTTLRMPAPRVIRASLGMAVIVSAVIAAGLSVRLERARLASERGDPGMGGLAPTPTQARRMIRGAGAAVGLDPGFAIYDAQLGTAFAGGGRLADARSAFAHAVVLDRFWPWSIDLAWLEAASGDKSAATARMEDIAAIYPADLPVLSNASALMASLGDTTAAQGYLSELFAASPRLAAVPGWWTTSPIRTQLPAVIRDARTRLSGDPLALAELDLWTHSIVDAKSALARASPSPSRDALEVAAGWFDGGESQARGNLQDLAERDPLNIDAVGWALRFARDAGDRNAIARYTRWLQILDPVGGAPYLSVDGTSASDRLQQLLAVPLHASSVYQRYLRTTTLIVAAVVGSSAPPTHGR